MAKPIKSSFYLSDQIRVMGPRDNRKTRKDEMVIMTVSKDGTWRGLSPFVIGPCPIPQLGNSKCMENAWQFAKLYKQFADEEGNPTSKYWAWALRGWRDSHAHRYPMGKGVIPLCSIWKGCKLSYIQARKRIYIPLYRDAVRETESYEQLRKLVKSGREIALWDYDGYDHERAGLSLWQVINNPDRKCGHAFVLKMMLTYGAEFRLSDVHGGPV